MAHSRLLVVGSIVACGVAAAALLWPSFERWHWARQAWSAARTNPEVLIVPGVGVGDIQLNMGRPEVEALLGKPQLTMGPFAAAYLTLGLAIIYDHENQVNSIFGGGPTLDSPLTLAFKGRTASGIGMRSNAEHVKAALGEPGVVRRAGEAELWEYPKQGVTFIFELGALRHVTVQKVRPDA